MASQHKPDGIVVGISTDGKPIAPAAATSAFSSSDIAARFAATRASPAKNSQLRLLYGDAQDAPVVAAVTIGEQKPAPSTSPDSISSKETFLRNERLEFVRLAAATGAAALRDVGAPTSTEKADAKAPVKRTIAVDPMGSPHAAATGARLALWQSNHWKTRGSSHAFGVDPELQGGKNISIVPLVEGAVDAASIKDEGDIAGLTPPLSWETGTIYAEAQNWARELMEAPANHMTPTIFCERAKAKFAGLANVEIIVHDEEWARGKKMGSFLSVAAGTEEPAKMLEIVYKGAGSGSPSLGFVGKGITFDTGGISLKPGAGMKLMRADMGGAATVVAATWALAKLAVPINLVTVTPLTENMPSGHATKPGDIVQAMNGLTIEVDNTDAEGRLVLADALTYVSREHKPATLIDVATLTGAVLVAVGHEWTGTFTEDDKLWHDCKTAGEAEHDHLWRLPLSDCYLPYVDTSNSDIVNVGRPAGSSTAAIFLKQFVDGLEDRSKLKEGTDEGKARTRWAHWDIAAAMESVRGNAYQPKGLTGRPARALIEFARRLAAEEKK